MKVTLEQKHDPALVKAARTFVSQTFFGQMLKTMRSSPFKSELFNGGRGGEAFQNQLDQKLAERMSNSHAGDRLVMSMVRHIDGKKGSHVATDLRA